MKALIPLLVAAALACPAHAQERPPAARQQLTELAYLLGESHALRQTCEGPGDMFWRARMEEMLRVEAADQAFTNRLSQSFNSGYGAGQASYPACDAGARAELRRTAARGRALAARLSAP